LGRLDDAGVAEPG